MTRSDISQAVIDQRVPEQAAMILLAAHCGVLPVPGIREWACSVIETLPSPPFWLFDLATMRADGLAEALEILHVQAAPLDLHTRLQTIIGCHASGLPLLPDTLRELFFVAIIERHGQPDLPDIEPLVDALVAWDCQEDPDHIPAELEARFQAIFRDYLAEANAVMACLRAAHLNIP